MNTTPTSTPGISSTTSFRRALVLAGGGAAGNAWELGLIAGLSDAGVDVTEADLIIGTSAGSTVAAQITSGTRPAELYAAILTEVPQPQAGGAGSDRRRAPNFSGPTYMEWSNGIIGSAEDASDMRRRMGAAALDMDASDGSGQTRWHDIVAARLPSQDWPHQPVLIAAVDAHTGEPVVFDRHSGIDLVDAVAASTSNGFRPFGAYRIGENRYINGGYRRSENADLAAGYGLVLVLSPFRRQVADAAGVGHGSRNPSRRTARGGQQGRDRLSGRRRGRRVQCQCFGPVNASAGRARRLRPRPSPRGAARRNLA